MAGSTILLTYAACGVAVLIVVALAVGLVFLGKRPEGTGGVKRDE